MKATQLSVAGFLGVKEVKTELKTPVTLFCGANASGKSSIVEAVRLAVAGDLVRVEYIKDAPQMLHDGCTHAAIALDTDAGVFSASIAGKKPRLVIDKPTDDVRLKMVLDAQRFANEDVKTRGKFLYELMGVKTTAISISARLIEAKCNAAKVARVSEFLRAGFDSACERAKTEAREEKAAWQAVTKEAWGSDKGLSWKATEPKFNAAELPRYETEVLHATVAIDKWNQQVGSLLAQQRHAQEQKAKLPDLHAAAALLDRAKTKMDIDQVNLTTCEEQLKTAQAAAGGEARVGLVHDLAHSLSICVADMRRAGVAIIGKAVIDLNTYTAQYGAFDAAPGDPEAAELVRKLNAARSLYLSALNNATRDYNNAVSAQATAQAIEAELMKPFDREGLEAAQAEIAKIKEQMAKSQEQVDRLRAAKRDAEAAGKKTEEALEHHTNIVQWLAIAEQLAPDGIPARLLQEVLPPFNERLAMAAADTGWKEVTIDDKINVLYGGREYQHLSKSEKWRVQAMIAEAVSNLAGLKFLVLDEFDLLDAGSRGAFVDWMSILAENNEVDSALIFGTLTKPPTTLDPDVITVHWLVDGQIAEYVPAPEPVET